MPVIPWDNLLTIQDLAPFDTALAMAVAMRQNPSIILQHPGRPEGMEAMMLAENWGKDYLKDNDAFRPLRQYPELWAFLPPERARHLFDTMIEYYKNAASIVLTIAKPMGDKDVTLHSFEGNNIRPCVHYLMMYRGDHAFLRRLQRDTYDRLATLDHSTTGKVARTLLIHGSFRDKPLKRVLRDLTTKHPILFAICRRLVRTIEDMRKLRQASAKRRQMHGQSRGRDAAAQFLPLTSAFDAQCPLRRT